MPHHHPPRPFPSALFPLLTRLARSLPRPFPPASPFSPSLPSGRRGGARGRGRPSAGPHAEKEEEEEDGRGRACSGTVATGNARGDDRTNREEGEADVGAKENDVVAGWAANVGRSCGTADVGGCRRGRRGGDRGSGGRRPERAVRRPEKEEEEEVHQGTHSVYGPRAGPL